MDVPGTITAVGALVTALGVIVIAIVNSRNATKARLAEASAQFQRDQMKLASDNAATLALKAAEKAEEATARLVLIDGQILETRKALDGRLTLLLDEVRKASRAEGKAEGRAEQKAERPTREMPIHPQPAPAPLVPPPVDVNIVGTSDVIPVEVKDPKEKK